MKKYISFILSTLLVAGISMPAHAQATLEQLAVKPIALQGKNIDINFIGQNEDGFNEHEIRVEGLDKENLVHIYTEPFLLAPTQEFSVEFNIRQSNKRNAQNKAFIAMHYFAGRGHFQLVKIILDANKDEILIESYSPNGTLTGEYNEYVNIDTNQTYRVSVKTSDESFERVTLTSLDPVNNGNNVLGALDGKTTQTSFNKTFFEEMNLRINLQEQIGKFYVGTEKSKVTFWRPTVKIIDNSF